METLNRRPVYPLRLTRERTGIAAKSVIERGIALSRHFPKTTDHLYVIEIRGTKNYHLITALASIYGIPSEELARIADYSELR